MSEKDGRKDTVHWLVLYDQDQRIQVRYPDIRWEETPWVVWHIALSENQAGMLVMAISLVLFV